MTREGDLRLMFGLMVFSRIILLSILLLNSRLAFLYVAFPFKKGESCIGIMFYNFGRVLLKLICFFFKMMGDVLI